MFLAVFFSMIEITCWNVSMTSTISTSDLLNSFAPSGFHGLRWYRRRHACWSRSIGSSLCWTILCSWMCTEILSWWFLLSTVAILWPSFGAFGFRLHLHCMFGRSGRGDLSNLIVDAPSSGCSVVLTTAWLGVFRSSKVFASVLVPCAYCWITSLPVQAVTSEARSFSGTASVLCWTTGILHFVAELNSELSWLFHLISTCIVELVSAPSRDRQQPCYELRLEKFSCFCVICACSCGTSFITMRRSL